MYSNVEEDRCKEARPLGQGDEGHSTYTCQGDEDPSWRPGEGVHGDEKLMKKAKGICDALLTAPKKKLTANEFGSSRGVILAQPVTTLAHPDGGEGAGFRASAIKDPVVVIKLA